MSELVVDRGDPLTIAYITIGVMSVLEHAASLADVHSGGLGVLRTRLFAAFDRYGGQLGVISTIIEHAITLDRRVEEFIARDGGASFTAPYDIAQPFGVKAARALLEHGSLDAERILDEMFEVRDALRSK